MTALPDPGGSRAVLIGASTYSHLEDLPAVHNNLAGFREILIDPALGGLPANKCTVLEQPSNGLGIYQALRTAATAAEDTLVVYFSGHGRTGARNELYLCLPDTDPDVLTFTALAYNDLREVVAEGRATKKVVILDCCFSGRALADLAGSEETIVGQVGIEGSYILTATPANAVALAPLGERYTAFTGALLDVLHTGIPGGRELLTFAEIYPRLKYTLTSRQLPQPRQRGSDTITDLALTRNPAYTPHDSHASTRSSAGAASTSALLPEALAASLDNPRPAIRIGAVNILGGWLDGDDPVRARIAEQRLQQIADTDIPAVAAAARACLPDPGRDPVSTSAHVRGVQTGGNPAGEAAQVPQAAHEPVRGDPARTARLFADAERTAQSISDNTTKVSALADVAEAVAATNPDRAERLALSIQHENAKLSALAGVAKAVAATNPDRAERLALSIQHENAKLSALVGVAKAVAATDPDRAERIAQSITNPDAKAEVLHRIAKAVAATDPDRAERIAQSITDEYEQQSQTLLDVAKAVAATDPDRAERIAQSITDEYEQQSQTLLDVAKAVAATDPDRAVGLFADAERTAQSITEPDAKAEVLRRIAKAVAATDPDRAERIAQSITDEYWQQSRALLDVVDAVAATDSDRAERIAQSITDDYYQASALVGVAKAVAGSDPDRAERIAQSITGKNKKENALRQVAAAVAATDPDRAERLARSITDQETKMAALRDIAAAMATTNPDRATELFTAAERIAESITDQETKMAALRDIAAAMATTNPDRATELFTAAERIAESITDQETKMAALRDIAAAMATTNPDRAERIAERIAQSSISTQSKALALDRIMSEVAAADPDRAERIAQLNTGSRKVAALLKIVNV